MDDSKVSYKEIVNRIIGNCLDEIEKKTGIIMDAKVNGRTVSLYLNDEESLVTITLKDIEKSIMTVLNIDDPKLLRGKCRKRAYSDARTMFCDISRKYGFTVTAIGDFMSRDHTTVVHHSQKARDLFYTDPVFIDKYSRVLNFLKSENGKVVY